MKLRICTCRGIPTDVFLLDDEEKIFFNDSSTNFIEWFNHELKRERKISKSYQKILDMDELIEENKKLKEKKS